jgi:type IV pilus assembly protein PilE
MKIKQKGFTLIELMITVAIVGILTSVGYPSYQNHIRKAKRVEAQGALVAFATAMEQWRVENNGSYCGSGSGCPTLSASDIFAVQVPTDGTSTKTYDLAFDADPTDSYYKLKATPVNTDDCGTLTLDSTGVKGASLPSGCWD